MSFSNPTVTSQSSICTVPNFYCEVLLGETGHYRTSTADTRLFLARFVSVLTLLRPMLVRYTLSFMEQLWKHMVNVTDPKPIRSLEACFTCDKVANRNWFGQAR